MKSKELEMYEYYREDRIRGVKTTKERHGADFYSVAGSKGGKATAKKRGPEFYRLMILKRWHKDWFDSDGKIKEEFKHEVARKTVTR